MTNYKRVMASLSEAEDVLGYSMLSFDPTWHLELIMSPNFLEQLARESPLVKSDEAGYTIRGVRINLCDRLECDFKVAISKKG